MFPILPLIQAGMGVVNAKKQENAAKKENAARAALGEAPTAQPGPGMGGALMSGLGGVMGAMQSQKPAAEPDGDESPPSPPPHSAPPNLPPAPNMPNPALGSNPAPGGDANSFTPAGTQALGGPLAMNDDLTQGLGLGGSFLG